MTTYYLNRQTGSDRNSGTSENFPLLSLSKLSRMTFKPGDSILLKKGQTFSGSATISSSGTGMAPITVSSYGPISSPAPVLTNPGRLYILKLDGQYMNIDNLRFQDSVSIGTFHASTYHDSGAVVMTEKAKYSTVTNCEFTRVGVGVKTYAESSSVRNNHFHDLKIAYRDDSQSYGAIGVSANNSRIDIGYNNFVNCRSTDSPYGADGGAIEIEGYDFSKDLIYIHHNTSIGNQGFVEVTETTANYVDISENLSNDYQQFVAWDTTNHPFGFNAYNNTVIRGRDWSKAIEIYYYREPGPQPEDQWLSLHHNVFWTPTGTVFSGFEYIHYDNIFGGQPDPLGGFRPGDGDLFADPAFDAPSQGDYHLTASSPRRDVGATRLR